MSCLLAPTDNLKTQSLLTKEEKLAYLRQLFFLGKANKHGSLFAPSAEFYKSGRVDEEHLLLMAKELLRWLGIKHSSLKVGFINGTEAQPTYTPDRHKPAIALPYSAAQSSFYCGALLAHCLMHYFLITRTRIFLTEEQNEDFTDMACVQAGLGIVLLNGYAPYKNGLYGFFNRRNIYMTTPGMTAGQIAAGTMSYIETNHLGANKWVAFALPGARSLLKQAPMGSPAFPYVRAQQHAIHRANFKTTLLFMIAGATISLSIFFFAQRAKPIPAGLADRKEAIIVLRSQYQICQEYVDSKKTETAHEDILKARVIEAEESRCKSIRNRLNSEVDLYNSELRRL